MIEVNNLSLVKQGKKLLDDVSFSAENGHITGLVGSNGSGKTLIMKCICGLIVSYDGNIMIDGIEARST